MHLGLTRTGRAFLPIAALALSLATILPAQSATPKKPLPPLPPPALPVAIYLTWQRAPTETMTVHWHTEWTSAYSDSVLEYRTAAASDAPWTRATGNAQPMPFTERMIHTVELTGLESDTVYQFRFGRLVTREADGAMLFHPHGPVHTFRTLPATLSRPVRFVSGGDIYSGSTPVLMANMCRAAASQNTSSARTQRITSSSSPCTPTARISPPSIRKAKSSISSPSAPLASSRHT